MLVFLLTTDDLDLINIDFLSQSNLNDNPTFSNLSFEPSVNEFLNPYASYLFLP